MEPWDFDYELDHAAVERLARQCGLSGPIEPLGAGWDYAMFVCDRHVLRIPKRHACSENLSNELALLAQLPRDLPLQIPRPRETLMVTPGLPYPAMIYPLIPGTPLTDHGGSGDSTALGHVLGFFVRRLHASQPSVPGTLDLREWREFALDKIERMRAELDESLLVRVAQRLDQLPVLTSRHVLCHQDLGAEHIIVDDAGVAVAVIDWGDADVGPWWFDFTGLYNWGGHALLGAALNAYGRSLDREESHYLHQHALLATVNDLYGAVRMNDRTGRRRKLEHLEKLVRAPNTSR
jgi:aminoglycoside phosphotransferase (APT) family kinase protein